MNRRPQTDWLYRLTEGLFLVCLGLAIGYLLLAFLYCPCFHGSR